MPTRDEYDTLIILRSTNKHLGGTDVGFSLVIQALSGVLTGFAHKMGQYL